jgi:hypothetical protein
MYIDSYPSSSGIRIMFLLRSPEDRNRLRQVFVDLANQRITEIALKREDWMEFSANCLPLNLKLVDHEVSSQIQFGKTHADGKVFAWSRHTEGWLECADKIEALTEPGHQYLGGGVAEIEVSFLENLQRK